MSSNSISNALTIVNEIESKRDRIFDKILSYLCIRFNKSNDTIQLKDKDNGRIIVNSSIDFIAEATVGNEYLKIKCIFSLVIDIRDYKYRVQFINPSYTDILERRDAHPTLNPSYLYPDKSKFSEIISDMHSYISKREPSW